MDRDVKTAANLCPVCKTGRDSYLLDKRSVFCPNLACLKGNSCSMFVAIDDKKTRE